MYINFTVEALEAEEAVRSISEIKLPWCSSEEKIIFISQLSLL